MVKADGYGLGAVQVATALNAAGCSRFFVATIDEGIALRQALPDPAAAQADTRAARQADLRTNIPDIYVLNGLMGADNAAEFDQADLIPVLNTPDEIDRWSARGRDDGGRRAILAIDTGMHRLGMSPAETTRLGEEPNRLSGLSIDYVMSHLACADEPDHPMNQEQRALFDRLRALLPPARASFANSGGIFLGPDFHYDLARPGAALYGVSRATGAPEPMRQCVVLKGKILQIRVVDSDSGVGYGATCRVSAGTRLATVATGYADGYLRSFGNAGHGYINNVRVPVVGRVSMDLVVFDISELPQNAVNSGDYVEFLNDRQTVDDLADDAGTIGYEILTALGGRYSRDYIGVSA